MQSDPKRQLEFYWGVADPSHQLEEPANMKVIVGFECNAAIASSSILCRVHH